MPAAPTWTLKYKISFTNENNELCIVNLSSKTDNGDVVNLQADEGAVSISWPNSEEDKFTGVRGSELTLKLIIYAATGVELDTFLGADDEWKVDYYKSDLAITNWQGFLVQDEHTREMQDEPWNLELHAVDGLAWFKDKPLVKPDGTKYSGLNFLLDYAGDILWQVNPYLKLVTHINIFHIAMDDRDISPEKDPWMQIKVEARTWLSDATTFEDCYSVLEKMLVSWGLTLFQWYGAWHIIDLWDFMRGDTSFTSYSYDLGDPTDAHVRIVDGGEINKVFECKIAPHAVTLWSGPVEPEGEDQTIGLKFANKSVRLLYNFISWPELPLNNKFERGSLIAPLSGIGYTAFTVDDWEHGKLTLTSGIPFTLGSTTKNAYSKRTYDSFGIEQNREIVLETPTGYTTTEIDVLRSEGFPVTAGDKFDISFQYRTNTNIVGGAGAKVFVFRAYVINDAGTAWYGLRFDPQVHTVAVWQLGTSGFLGGIEIRYEAGEDSTEPHSSSVASPAIPFTGKLYLAFDATSSTANTATEQHWSGFEFTYRPFTAGGYRQVKGEAHFIAQDQEYKQKSDVEIFLNDSIHGVLKGAMYRYTNVGDTWILSEPRWYRYTYTETLRFAEIQALKRFWHTYRAMQKIDGTFSGLIFFGDTELPLGLLQTFWPEWLGSKRYMLTNLEQDHKTATFKGTMIEVGSLDDSSITIDTNEHQYVFE